MISGKISGICRHLVCFLLLLGLTLPYANFSAHASETDIDMNAQSSSNSYFDYYIRYQDSPESQENVIVFENDYAVEISEQNNSAEWEFTITGAAKYAVFLNYIPIAGNGNDITFSISIDGKMPFDELGFLTVPRTFSDERDEDGSFFKDSKGNDRLPVQKEVFKFTEKWLCDVQGMYSEPYQIYLEEGTHKLTVNYYDGAFEIGKLMLGQPRDTVSYEEYCQNVEAEDENPTETIRIEAALSYEKSDSGFYPLTDKSNASTEPNEPGITLFNSIGGSNWSYVGDSISWKTEIPVSGWYKIAVKARQNLNQGMNSYRALKIDGEIKFKELEMTKFPYDIKWNVYELGDEEPYLIYLSSGEHIITMECVAGELSEEIRRLNRTLSDLNAIYREIIMVTGASPDIYKDYNLDTTVSGLTDTFTSIEKSLREISDGIGVVVSTKDTQASILDEMAIMLSKMIESPYTIPMRLDEFKGNIESLGTLLLSLTQQPLTVDYIELVPKDNETQNGKIGFIKSAGYHIKSFLYSFVSDYSEFDNANMSGEKTVNVWVSSGRDQVKAVNQIINDNFVLEYGIPIKLNMVNTSTTLIQATLAGKGPDVALMVPQDTPVNLASRGALVDLSQFDKSQLLEEISEEAFIPFEYNGGLYGLPETQTFRMLFYRTDIFEELGLKVPDTWEDFYNVMNILQFNNLEVGIAEVANGDPSISLAISFFKTLLYQNGGQMFEDDLSKTKLTTETSYNAFETTVKLYSDYGLDQSYDFFNRFRTGEMAMAIEFYSVYNQLKSAAPELNGLWNFAPIPGTVDENGNINRSNLSSVTGCIMLKSAEEKGIENEAWQFMSWWVGASAQSSYADLLESSMGIIGRYTPANHKAFSTMRWSGAEAKLLNEQWETTFCIPEVPGNYSIDRSLTSALRSAISNGSPRRELSLYNKDINNEIARKRKEFGLS